MQESLHNKNGKFAKNMMTETACTLFLNNKIDLVPTILAVVIHCKANKLICWTAEARRHIICEMPTSQKIMPFLWLRQGCVLYLILSQISKK